MHMPRAERLTPAQSQLTSQLQKQQSAQDDDTPFIKGPLRPRPWSTLALKPALSPSPFFIEPTKISKDDTCIDGSPATPKRPSLPPRGLSLQMPPRDTSSSSTANLTSHLPLSPKPETSTPYNTSASVLPRRSRGMDFSRACTNLHHSTLAEQSSPDSSPIIGGGSRGVMIPSRKSLHNALGGFTSPESPGNIPNSLWSTMGNPERNGISGSLGSVNMLGSDSGSGSSDGDDEMAHGEDEDTIHMTPSVYKAGGGMSNPFPNGTISSQGVDSMNLFSPSATANLMSFQRARLRHGRSRKSSSSASGNSSMQSPGPGSPPLFKSVEPSLNGGYFPRELARREAESRRESLSLGTDDLHISDGLESEENEVGKISPHDGVGVPIPVTPTLDDRRNVIRRAVTRRGNLLVSIVMYLIDASS